MLMVLINAGGAIRGSLVAVFVDRSAAVGKAPPFTSSLSFFLFNW
jgi:hypothetical protein